MKYSTAIFVFLILAAAGSATAQRKQVTNADLEKYRQTRLNAEREYRENYERLGLPSPAELERRREQSRIETERLSEKLRSEEIERERLNMAAEYRRQTAVSVSRAPVQQPSYGPIYYLANGSRYWSPRIQSGFQQLGYVAGGTFWPTSIRTPPQPLFPRRKRR